MPPLILSSNGSGVFNGEWMHLFWSILICEDIPEEAYLLHVGFPLSGPPNRSSTRKDPRRWKSWVLMTSCQKYVGPGISLQHEAKMSKIIVFVRARKVLFLWNNGKASSSKRTKHVHIRYFFITDRLNKDELSVAWCPTGGIIGDYMTKPLRTLCSGNSDTKSWE